MSSIKNTKQIHEALHCSNKSDVKPERETVNSASSVGSELQGYFNVVQVFLLSGQEIHCVLHAFCNQYSDIKRIDDWLLEILLDLPVSTSHIRNSATFLNQQKHSQK